MRRLRICSALLLGLLVHGPAQATVLEVSYEFGLTQADLGVADEDVAIAGRFDTDAFVASASNASVSALVDVAIAGFSLPSVDPGGEVTLIDGGGVDRLQIRAVSFAQPGELDGLSIFTLILDSATDLYTFGQTVDVSVIQSFLAQATPIMGASFLSSSCPGGGGSAMFCFGQTSLTGYSATAVPLPAGLALLASGLGALGWLRRRRSA